MIFSNHLDSWYNAQQPRTIRVCPSELRVVYDGVVKEDKKTCRHRVLSLSPRDIWQCVTARTGRHLLQFGRGARDWSRNAGGARWRVNDMR